MYEHFISWTMLHNSKVWCLWIKLIAWTILLSCYHQLLVSSSPISASRLFKQSSWDALASISAPKTWKGKSTRFFIRWTAGTRCCLHEHLNMEMKLKEPSRAPQLWGQRSFPFFHSSLSIWLLIQFSLSSMRASSFTNQTWEGHEPELWPGELPWLEAMSSSLSKSFRHFLHFTIMARVLVTEAQTMRRH